MYVARDFDGINPRTAGGDGYPPRSGFCKLAKSWRRVVPPNFTQLFGHQLRTLCENFDPISYQVRSPGHVI